MNRSARIACAAAAALALTAPVANAETFEAKFGPAEEKNEFTWDGVVSSPPFIPVPELGTIGWACEGNDPIVTCDYVVIEAQGKGELEASIDMTAGDPLGTETYPDVDMYLYKADDAEGTRAEDAEPIASGATAAMVETFKAQLEPGFYVLEVSPFWAVEADYSGELKFAPAPVEETKTELPKNNTGTTTTTNQNNDVVYHRDPPPPAAPQSSPPPQPQPASYTWVQPTPKAASKKTTKRSSRSTACTRKARRIKSAKKRKSALKRCAKKR